MVDTWLVIELCPKVMKLESKNKINTFILDYIYLWTKNIFCFGNNPKNLDLILSRI